MLVSSQFLKFEDNHHTVVDIYSPLERHLIPSATALKRLIYKHTADDLATYVSLSIGDHVKIESKLALSRRPVQRG